VVEFGKLDVMVVVMGKNYKGQASTRDFTTGLLLGFLVTVYVLFIVKPMLAPQEVVAPAENNQYLK